MDYKTIEDLLMDDGFMAWYRRDDPDMVARWEKWMGESEKNKQLAEAAARAIQLFQATKEAESTHRKTADNIWDRIHTVIQEDAKEEREARTEERADEERKRRAEILRSKGMTIGTGPRPAGSGSKPSGSRRPAPGIHAPRPQYLVLLGSYVKIGLRNLTRNKVPSFINIFGLSVGMAVTMLIAFWIWDELSFNTFPEHYDRVASVLINGSSNGEKWTGGGVPVPLADELRRSYPDDFQYVSLTEGADLTLSAGDNISTHAGAFMEADAPKMLSLKMLEGTRDGLKEPASVLLSESVAKGLFGKVDPMGRVVKVNNSMTVKVSGVYEDLPHNSDMNDVSFIVPWTFFMKHWQWIRDVKENWQNFTPGLLVQLYPNGDFKKISEKIKDAITRNAPPDTGMHVNLFLYPMSRWHLYGDFNNWVNTGGLIGFVWLFGLIGVFVLLLACINFMNLSTARSEKRAKEVGIRKVMGSLRGQLIGQFFSESILMTQFSLILAIVFVQLMLPWFNQVADKNLSIPWGNPWFWIAGVLFSLVTGLIAGSYPAVYLSSFQPVKVLKGTFRVGRLATIPRKVLVVVQFTVSVLLITGTVIVYRQIQFAKDRPVGYNPHGIISIRETTPEIYDNYQIIRDEMLRSGAATELSESQCPITQIWANSGGFKWEGKDPGFHESIAVIGVRHEYGKVVDWQIKEGRDFSASIRSDSDGLVLNESAVRYMGLKHPIGQTIHWQNRDYKILGVIKDMIMASPYGMGRQTIFYISGSGNIINIRINPAISMSDALKKTEAIFKKYNPGAPFAYTFVDQDYAKKFGEEERIGTLAAFFALLAILISCLGLYGLAAFVAEQRTKEIGIRKVLGASLVQLWGLLSKEFVVLVVISLLVAMPMAGYFMHKWLQRFEYHAGISWWIFALSGLSALLITLLTVSYQAIRAGRLSPVKSLRTE